jgi:hypothetical protein
MEIMIKKNDVRVVNDEEVSTYQNKGYETLITDMGFRKHPEYIEWDVFNRMETIYPLTIKADRYSGVYSGGEYTAWPCSEADIPDEVFADDVTCAHEWGVIKSERQHVGIGCTPSVALVDLYLKQHSIFVEDYLGYNVEMAVNGVDIKITPFNERPILIDFTTARKIAEIVDSKAGAKADAVNDDNDKDEDSDNNPEDTALIDLEDISVVAELIADDIIDWNHSNGTDFEVIISEGERTNVEVRIVDIRHPKLTTTLYWRREWTYGYFSDNYLFKALQELTT